MASSNAIQKAFGKIAGIPNNTPLKRGVIIPISKPYGHPQIYPHNNTGICIGQSIFPTALDGLDALLATVQMPSGFPVATVALNGAKNAAYLAVAILAVADDGLAAKLDKFRADTAAAIAKKDAAIAAEAAAL